MLAEVECCLGDAIFDVILGIPWECVEAAALLFVVELVGAFEGAIHAGELEGELWVIFEVSEDGGAVAGDDVGVDDGGDG